MYFEGLAFRILRSICFSLALSALSHSDTVIDTSDCPVPGLKEEATEEDLEKSLFEQLQDCSNMEVSDETILHNFTANVRPDSTASADNHASNNSRTVNLDSNVCGTSLKRGNDEISDPSSVKRIKQDNASLEKSSEDEKVPKLNDTKTAIVEVLSDENRNLSSKERGSKRFGRGKGHKKWGKAGYGTHENVDKWGRKKRAWEAPEENKVLGPKDEEERKWFSAKKKVAILLSYCGAEYHGMQKNPDVDTIEERLLEALACIRAIRREHKDAYLKNEENMMNYQSASRTDKGVSAAQQVVSMKIVAEDDFLEKVNMHLPENIRVLGLERVTKTFNAKISCFGRVYEYVTPSFAFAPSKSEYGPSYRISGMLVCAVLYWAFFKNWMAFLYGTTLLPISY